MIKSLFLYTLLTFILLVKNNQAEKLTLKANFILPMDSYIEVLLPKEGSFVRPPSDVYIIFNWGPQDLDLTPIKRFGIKNIYLRAADSKDVLDGIISEKITLSGKFMIQFHLNKLPDILKHYYVEISYAAGTYTWDFYVVLPSDTGGIVEYPNKIRLSVGENVCPMDVYFEIVNTSTTLVKETLLPLQDYFYYCNFLYKSKATQSTGLKLKDYAVLRLKYKDIDNDGVVDNTRVGELSLKGVYLRDGLWNSDYDLCKVYPNENEVLFLIDNLDTFGLAASLMTDLTRAVFAPNPFDLTKYSYATFKNLTGDVKFIKIYTLDGELVREITPNMLGAAQWDGTDNNGDKVSSGIYFWIIQREGEYKVGKLTVIR